MLAEGRVISERYEIVGRVGSGGMADVYKAQDRRLSRFVAIKILKQEYSSDKNFVTKFRGEAQSVAGLSHPNIVNVYDVGEDGGLYYIVMELIEGITLKKFIERKGRLEIKEAVGIAIQIAQGMEAAHNNHIIHRDIKPQNIIISRDGKIKVTDFGIARAASSNTLTTAAMGSVHYISPEQARGGYSDEKSDIYSLGVTLYEMLSGSMPFAADNTVSVALLHIQEEATPLRELDPSIPASIEKIVQKCMQKKPERRYLSAGELIADLKRSISNPDGEFVQMAAGAASNDSPTIHLSDEEMSKIRSARYSPDRSGESERAEEEELLSSPGGGRPQVLEEDDSDEMDPRMEKIMLAGGITAIVILAAVIIVLVVRGFHLFDSKKNPDENLGTNKTPGIEGTDNPDESQQPDDNDPNGTEDPDQNPNDPDHSDDPNSTEDPKEQDEEEDNQNPDEEEDPDELEQFPMPDVKGRKFSDAVSVLEGNKLTNYSYERQFSDTFEKDTVVSQQPEAGVQVDTSQKITLVISDGKQVLKVPDVYNRTQEEAEEALQKSELLVKHDYDYSDDLEEGRVIYTSPARGEEVRKGDTVTIVLSRGPKTVMTQVPSLVGKTEAEALQLLKDANLNGKVSYAHSDKVENGLVITQDTSIGVSVEENSTIGFSVSLGKEEPTYSYIGSVVIDQLPLPDGVESAYVTICMDQTGQEGVVLWEGNISAANIPLTIKDIKGTSLNSGIVYVKIGDETYDGKVWYAEFIQVEN